MSAKIPIRTAGGQVLEVPPIRLNWATEHPRLVELVDRVGSYVQGRGGETPLPMPALMAELQEFVEEVAKVAGYQGAPLDVDLPDVVRIHLALRGIDPDPIRASQAGSDT